MSMSARVASIVAVALVVGCNSEPKPKPTPAVPLVRSGGTASDEAASVVGDAPLHNGEYSLEALGQAVVKAIAANDGRALTSLCVAQREFEQRLFGSLVVDPQARRPGPAAAWKKLWGESLANMGAVLREHGGKGYTFVSLESTQQEQRDGLVIHENPKLTVENADGKRELKVLGQVLEHPASGTFVILSFSR